jgi:hypothetical protein
MCQRCHRGKATDRRNFLMRTASALGAAGLAGLYPQHQGAEAADIGSSGTVDLARPASVMELWQALPAPSPIPGGFDAGPPLGFLHIFLPGPEDARTPFFGIPGEGLDVEPSTITDFKGFTAFAVVAGQAEGSDGKTYNVEFDLRVMEGEYIAEDGSHHRGAFAFF